MQVTYLYNGREYYIVDPNGKFKDPISREWVNAVAYKRADGTGVTYMKETNEFYNNFGRVEVVKGDLDLQTSMW